MHLGHPRAICPAITAVLPNVEILVFRCIQLIDTLLLAISAL